MQCILVGSIFVECFWKCQKLLLGFYSAGPCSQLSCSLPASSNPVHQGLEGPEGRSSSCSRAPGSHLRPQNKAKRTQRSLGPDHANRNCSSGIMQPRYGTPYRGTTGQQLHITQNSWKKGQPNKTNLSLRGNTTRASRPC